jgi:hypothetical protein
MAPAHTHKTPNRKRLAASETAAAERGRQNENEKKDLRAQLDKEKATSLVWQQTAEKSAAALERTKKDLANTLQVCAALPPFTCTCFEPGLQVHGQRPIFET